MAKKSPKVSSKIQDTPLPASLANMRVTPKKLQSQAYQQKLHAHYAAQLLPKSYSKLCQLVDEGNFPAIQLVLQAYSIIQSKSAVSIINQTNNVDARSVTVEDGGSEDRKSFASIARMLAAERERRQIEGSPSGGHVIEANFVPTPEGISK